MVFYWGFIAVVYKLRSFTHKSESGASYKAAGIYGPYYRKADYKDYDFRAIFFQDNQVLIDFFSKIKEGIQREFRIVFGLIPVICVVLLSLVGIVMYFCVLKPIKELTKASKGEKIMNILPVKKYAKMKNVNDEITTLKRILNDLLTSDDNDKKIESSHVLSNYDYPINVFYSKAIKEKVKTISTCSVFNLYGIVEEQFPEANNFSSHLRTDTGTNQSSIHSVYNVDNLPTDADGQKRGWFL